MDRGEWEAYCDVDARPQSDGHSHRRLAAHLEAATGIHLRDPQPPSPRHAMRIWMRHWANHSTWRPRVRHRLGAMGGTAAATLADRTQVRP